MNPITYFFLGAFVASAIFYLGTTLRLRQMAKRKPVAWLVTLIPGNADTAFVTRKPEDYQIYEGSEIIPLFREDT